MRSLTVIDDRLKFLEKQNEALLKALIKKESSPLLEMLIEQQKQILELSRKIGQLIERDGLRKRQIEWLHRRIQPLNDEGVKASPSKKFRNTEPKPVGPTNEV